MATPAAAISTTTLFDPITVGDLKLRSRVFMAPLTRCRAPGRVPTDLMATYYRQRASAGMILTEATAVDPMGVGYPDTPGVWSDEQTAGWRKITDAVHAEGGTILCQLWHVGRISDPFYLEGRRPVAPSAIKPSGFVSLVRPKKEFDTPRALERAEIAVVIAAYRRSAENAQRAGFDGVEIHGANGYLPDQFLQDGSNHRTDDYGGPIENRARFMLEATDAAVGVWGPGRVGVHLAPRADSHGMGDSDRAATFGYVATELGRRKIAFICARESLLSERPSSDRLGPMIKQKFGGVFIANEKFTREAAMETVAKGESDAVAFGVAFIANPDLPRRLREDAPLNAPRPELYYAVPDVSNAAGNLEAGYTDYPTMNSSTRSG